MKKIKLEDINFICIVHMRPDHIGGLIDANKKPVFTHVTIFISKQEADYNPNNKNFYIYGYKIKNFITNKELVKGIILKKLLKLEKYFGTDNKRYNCNNRSSFSISGNRNCLKNKRLI